MRKKSKILHSHHLIPINIFFMEEMASLFDIHNGRMVDIRV